MQIIMEDIRTQIFNICIQKGMQDSLPPFLGKSDLYTCKMYSYMVALNFLLEMIKLISIEVLLLI